MRIAREALGTWMIVAVALLMLWAAPICAQVDGESVAGGNNIQVTLLGDAAWAQILGGGHFWMDGGAVEGYSHVNGPWGAVAEGGFNRRLASATATNRMRLLTAGVGPRYTEKRDNGRLEFILQALGGLAFASDGQFPCSTGVCPKQTSLMVQTTYGMQWRWNRFVVLRVFQADWVHTATWNTAANTQNTLQFSAGVGFTLR